MSLHVLGRAADSPDGKVDSSAVLLAVGFPFWLVISPSLLAKSWLFDDLWLFKCLVVKSQQALTNPNVLSLKSRSRVDLLSPFPPFYGTKLKDEAHTSADPRLHLWDIARR